MAAMTETEIEQSKAVIDSLTGQLHGDRFAQYTQSANVLIELAKNPAFKASESNKRYITEKLTELQDHEWRLALLDAVTSGDTFYKVLLLGGAGVALFGTLGILIAESTQNELPGISVSNGTSEAAFMLIPAGLGLSGYAALMLAWPRVFGADGFKIECEAAVVGLVGGSIKIG